MRTLALLGLLAAACAAPYRDRYDAADARLRQFAAYRESPEGTADELRARLLPDGRPAIADEAPIDLAAGVDLAAATAAALATNAELRTAIARARMAIERIPQSAYPEPMNVEFSPLLGLSSEVAGLREIELMLSQMFPVPGTLDAQVAEAVAEALASIHEIEERENMVRADVAMAVADLYTADQSLEINASNRELLGTIADTVEARYRAGAVAQQDVLRAQLNRQTLDLRELDLRRMRRTAEAQLCELVGLPPGTPVGSAALGDPAEPPLLAPLLEGLEFARPDLRAAGMRLDASLSRLRLAELGYLPEIEVGAEPMWDNPRHERSMYLLDLMLSLPLKWLQRPRYAAAENEMRAGVAEAVADYRATRLRGRREAVAAHADLTSAVEEFTMLRDELVPTARQTLEAAQAAYEVAQVDLDSLMEAQMVLQDLEERREEARARAMRTAVELRRATGGVQ